MDWLIALVGGALPFLFVLACPIAMFLMMRMTMSGDRMRHMGGPADANARRLPPADRIALLERQQHELARQIAEARQELTESTSPVGERTS